MKRNAVRVFLKEISLSLSFMSVVSYDSEAWALELGCLGLNPGSSTYELCASRQVI